MVNKLANRPRAAKWVAALRSGEYTQGGAGLRSWIGGMRYHCCLGVAGELFCDPNDVGAQTSLDAGAFLVRKLEPVALLLGFPQTGDLHTNGDLQVGGEAVAYIKDRCKEDPRCGRASEAFEINPARTFPVSLLNDWGVPFDILADMIELYADELLDEEPTDDNV